MPYRANRQADFLTPQINYGGMMGGFWDQYRQGASRASQRQIDFDKRKSSIMNPQWQRFIQMAYNNPVDPQNFRFNR